jgi:methylase of polypeptide subunit release factors
MHEIQGITLETDKLGERSTNDNVFGIRWEEQPLTWMFAKPEIEKAIRTAGGSIDFLDVGTGSGVFAILAAKKFGIRVKAIDKNKRAIEFAKRNAENNGVLDLIEFEHSLYCIETAGSKQVKVIEMNPPYTIHPPGMEEHIQQFAAGGFDGMKEFMSQLRIARLHLAEEGLIFFNHMCLGRDGKPESIMFIPGLVGEDVSIIFTEILPMISSRVFLSEVYGKKHDEFVRWISKRFPELYYTVGIIKKDRKGRIENVEHNFDLKDIGWKDRIKLHQAIRRDAERNQRRKKKKNC